MQPDSAFKAPGSVGVRHFFIVELMWFLAAAVVGLGAAAVAVWGVSRTMSREARHAPSPPLRLPSPPLRLPPFLGSSASSEPKPLEQSSQPSPAPSFNQNSYNQGYQAMKDIAEQQKKKEYENGLLKGEQNVQQRLKEIERQQHEERFNYPCPDWLKTEKCFNVAVTGSSGNGKSSLCNTLRGLRNTDEGAAPTGAVETTKEQKAYPLHHSMFFSINLWDLPGGGTLNFPPKDYMQKMGLRHFDLVIVVTKGRFTEFDDELRKEMLRQNPPVPYLMVRTNVDIDVQNNDDDGISEEKTLKSIRAEFGKLYPSDLENGNFFLVNAKRRDRWDFPALEEKTLQMILHAREVPALFRRTLVWCMRKNNICVASLLQLAGKEAEAEQTDDTYLTQGEFADEIAALEDQDEEAARCAAEPQ